MSRNIVAMYADHGIAEAVVRDLLEAGVDRERIAVAVDEPARRYRSIATLSDRRRERNGAKGALSGLILGAILGLAAALIAAFVPEPGWTLGPDLTSSLVLSGALGAAIGVVLGYLAGASSKRGVPVPRRHPRAQVLARSGVVVAAEVPADRARRIAGLMDRHKPLDIDKRARGWHGQEGWRPLLQPVTAATVLAGREEQDDRAVADREPTVREQVRTEPRTERLEDRPLGSQRAASYGGDRDLSVLEPRFRQHWERQHRDRGEPWDAHRQAYALGARLAWDARNKPFTEFHTLDNLARMRWESTEHGDVPYRRVRESIVYGFEEGRLSFA